MTDANMMLYFPDKFHKAVPPKEYFWQVYAAIKPHDYDKAIEHATNRLNALKRTVRNSIKVTSEALQVFDDFSADDINLLSLLISEE